MKSNSQFAPAPLIHIRSLRILDQGIIVGNTIFAIIFWLIWLTLVLLTVKTFPYPFGHRLSDTAQVYIALLLVEVLAALIYSCVFIVQKNNRNEWRKGALAAGGSRLFKINTRDALRDILGEYFLVSDQLVWPIDNERAATLKDLGVVEELSPLRESRRHTFSLRLADSPGLEVVVELGCSLEYWPPKARLIEEITPQIIDQLRLSDGELLSKFFLPPLMEIVRELAQENEPITGDLLQTRLRHKVAASCFLIRHFLELQSWEVETVKVTTTSEPTTNTPPPNEQLIKVG